MDCKDANLVGASVCYYNKLKASLPKGYDLVMCLSPSIVMIVKTRYFLSNYNRVELLHEVKSDDDIISVKDFFKMFDDIAFNIYMDSLTGNI